MVITLAKITKCQHYKERILCYTGNISQHVKTANEPNETRLEHNSLMAQQGVKKWQGRNCAQALKHLIMQSIKEWNLGALLHCEVIKHSVI